MRSFWLFLPVLLLISCEEEQKEPETPMVNPAAKIWNDSAANYYMHSFEADSIKGMKAAMLADKATSIDSNFYLAYFNKLSYLNVSGQFEKGLQAALALHRIRPKNIDHIMQIGEMYDVLGDSLKAIASYKEALADYNVFLKDPKASPTTVEMTKMSRAICLILSGNEGEGKNEIERLYALHDKDGLGPTIAPFRSKSRQELVRGFKRRDLFKETSHNTADSAK